MTKLGQDFSAAELLLALQWPTSILKIPFRHLHLTPSFAFSTCNRIIANRYFRRQALAERLSPATTRPNSRSGDGLGRQTLSSTMAHHPRSPLSREWLSMMGPYNTYTTGSRDNQQTTDTPSSLRRALTNQQQQAAGMKPPPQRRHRQRTTSIPLATKKTLWWSSTPLTESPSMELEACSIEDGSSIKNKLRVQRHNKQSSVNAGAGRVRFDHSADYSKTRELAVASKKRTLSSNPTDRILDMFSDSLCTGFELDSPSMASLEKRLASSPILRNFLAPDDEDDESHLIGSDSESEISEPGTPKSMGSRSRSRSFDDSNLSDRPLAPQISNSQSDNDDDGDGSRIKYRNILRKIAKERKERRAIPELKMRAIQNLKSNTLSQASPNPHLSAARKSGSEDQNVPPYQKQDAQSGSTALRPLTKMTATFLESIGLSNSKSGSQSEAPAAPLRKELEAMEAALAAEKKGKSQELDSHSCSQATSNKESGLPASVKVYDGRPPSGIWSQSSSKSSTRHNVSKSVGPVPSIPLTETVSCLTDDASPYSDGSKMCVPPALHRQLKLFQNLKANKRENGALAKINLHSSGSDSNKSAGIISSNTLRAILAKSSHSTGTRVQNELYAERTHSHYMNKGHGPGSYEMEGKRHAYVAYADRGFERPHRTIRFYEHLIPPRFPTGGNEIVVKVDVSTISETDSCVRRGEYWGTESIRPLDLPIIPGVAFFGTIIQTDKAASRKGLKIGDKVMSLVRSGANARHICINPSQVVKVPLNLKFDHIDRIVCLPEIYLSAFHALHIDQKSTSRYSSNSLSGKAILILGGTTATGRALCELAIAAGSGSVYATTKEQQKYVVERAGAIPLDRDPHHWYSLLAGKMDMVICVDKGKNELSELKYEHIQALSRSGKLVVIGPPDDEGCKVIELATVDDQSVGTQRKLIHYSVFDYWNENLKQVKKDLSHLLQLLANKKIEPKILEKLPLTKVARAHEIIEKSSLGGFVLCEPWLKDSKDSHDDGSGGSKSGRKSAGHH